ncbi:MAG: alpha/beta hydrolase-fold protein, partial [Bacteroidota bacterium]
MEPTSPLVPQAPWSQGAAIAILLLSVAATPRAQQQRIVPGNEIVIGHSLVFSSDILEEEREIFVSLPASYAHSDQRYPVLYVLHGDFYFTYGTAYTERLAARGDMPEVITIGIPRSPSDNPRLIHGTPEADVFLRFLEDEVISFVDETYRTLSHRTLSGWHYSASFTLHTLLSRPDLFNGFIAASIFPLRTETIDFSPLERFLSSSEATKRTLYFGSDDTERSIAVSTREFGAQLDSLTLDNLHWHLDQSAGDGELTETVYRLLHPGLRAVYQDFRVPPFNDAASLNELGGLSFIDDFLAQRQATYGTPATSNSQLIFSILRVALSADDLSLFE